MEWVVMFLIFTSATAVLALEPTGPNTCAKYETYLVTKRVSYAASYEYRYTTWCFSIPPRCTRYRTKYHTEYKIKPEVKQKTVYYCCSGYNQVGRECKRRFHLFPSEYHLPEKWKSGRFQRSDPKYYDKSYGKTKGMYRKRDDSGWSKWGRWICTVTCGGGIAERTRFCRVSGHCDGLRMETKKCAENPCPEGAPPFLIEQAKKQISQNTRSFQVQKGEKIQIDCEGQMYRTINDYYHKAKGIWYHNQGVFYPEKERIGLLDSYKLYIAKAWPKDNGVWYCETHLDPTASLYTAVYTVAVENDVPDIQVKTGKSFSMPCNNAPLSKFFTLKLVTEWYHNTSLYEKFEDSKPEDVQELVIKSSTLEDNGIWMCKVKEKDDKSGRTIREWATNVVRVSVLESDGSGFEDYSLAISIIVLVLVFVIGIIIYYCVRSKKKSARKNAKLIDIEKGSASKKPHDRKIGKTKEGRQKEAPRKIAKKEVERGAKKLPKRDKKEITR